MDLEGTIDDWVLDGDADLLCRAQVKVDVALGRFGGNDAMSIPFTYYVWIPVHELVTRIVPVHPSADLMKYSVSIPSYLNVLSRVETHLCFF
jgi:hypothetical protein